MNLTPPSNWIMNPRINWRLPVCSNLLSCTASFENGSLGAVWTTATNRVNQNFKRVAMKVCVSEGGGGPSLIQKWLGRARRLDLARCQDRAMRLR
jgi:hypothetical protein